MTSSSQVEWIRKGPNHSAICCLPDLTNDSLEDGGVIRKSMKMYKAKARGKKVRTTLGTAPASNNHANLVDVSHLRKPIETSLFGLKQVLGLLETATQEVRDYISFECDLIYECRVCRTIFRSLANFILHKREYCKSKYHSLFNRDKDNDCQMTFKVPESSEVVPNSSSEDNNLKADVKRDGIKKSLSDVLARLEGKQKSEEIFKNVIEEDLSGELNTSSSEDDKSKNEEIALQEIGKSVSGVFQTLFRNASKDNIEDELMKSEVMEIHSIFNNDEVILGPDGKIISRPTNPFHTVNTPNFDLTCSICKQMFSTKKTLTHHIKYKHNNSKVVYLCPEQGCTGNVFANTWSVFRHLFKVHRKSTLQVKKLRAQIQASVIKRGHISENYIINDVCTSTQQSLNEQNIQWMDNFECDNDLQMCGGCGKRFERKAALNSHSQLCMKRLAVCNSMRENKRIDEDMSRSEKKADSTKAPGKSKLVGSQKRKTNIIRKNPAKVYEHVIVKENSAVIKKPQEPDKIDHDPLADTSDDVIYVNTINSEINNIFEPETVLLENVEIIDMEPLPQPKEQVEEVVLGYASSPNLIVCVSDDEDVPEPVITLESKAALYMDTKDLKCLPCNYKFRKFDRLLKHMSSHFKWFKFQCSICLFKSYDRKTLEGHLSKCHTAEKIEESTVVELLPDDVIKNCVEFESLPTQIGLEDNDANKKTGNTQNSSSDDVKDPSIQKMIMEVIFGNINNNSEGNTRPVRNRVMAKKMDDFVYEEDIKRLTSAMKPLKVYAKKRRMYDETKEQKF